MNWPGAIAWAFAGVEHDRTRKGLLGRISHQLISQDAGWHSVGEPDGGNVLPYDFLPCQFVPMMQKAGVLDDTTHQLACAECGEGVSSGQCLAAPAGRTWTNPPEERL